MKHNIEQLEMYLTCPVKVVRKFGKLCADYGFDHRFTAHESEDFRLCLADTILDPTTTNPKGII